MSFDIGFQLSWILYVLDVLVVAWVIYRLLLVVRGTRAVPMLLGLVLIVLVYFLARTVGLSTLAWLLGNFLSSIVLLVVVIFQDEIRRALTKVGLIRLLRGQNPQVLDRTLEEITMVVQKLSTERIGALFVLQRQVGLDQLLEEAVVLDALLSRKLLLTIFNKGTPLHDGAVLIVGDRIKAANCVLPLSFDPDLDPNLGTRHRAAIGLSERSDALVIVVSEANGAISLARDGKLSMNLDASNLRDLLHRAFHALTSEEQGQEVNHE